MSTQPTVLNPASRGNAGALVAACARELPSLAVLSSAEEVKPYECDGLSVYREQPGAVLLPGRESELVAALRLCAAAGVPVVARGAGTGLSGGALPLAELERFHGIKAAFDPPGRLNPGKAVPTLHRCAEFGRMHVKCGHESHPELPRF